MIDFSEYIKLHKGKQVMISAITGRIGGTLLGNKTDKEGNIIALIVQQYLHRIEVPTDEILNIREM
ncbi:MAG: hypothetical protein K2X86_15785 [Cytophagaceae bacterium]|nr:hypothetical protein [Cytophagaceae bacterium]